ncbi:MAG: hypothetical protein ACE37K_21235 [Planctomycetota bacterium]
MERTGTWRASVPFAWGQVSTLDGLGVTGQQTAWHVLQRWPDQSIRVAQAQWTQTLPASSVATVTIDHATTMVGPFVPHPVFAGGLPELGSRVVDRFGIAYHAEIAGAGEVLQQSPLVRVRRWRTHHRTAPAVGIDRDFLSSTFYVTELHDEPVVLVDWLLGNDYLGEDQPNGSSDPDLYPLGDVDVEAASFRFRGADLGLAYRGAEHGVGPASSDPDGFVSRRVMSATWLADGQTRRYRFLLYRDDPAATTPQLQQARAAAEARVATPVRTLATHQSWRDTHALGLLGGPGQPPSDAAQRAAVAWSDWSSAAHFGTWGSRGDPLVTGQTGTPRNHPLSPELAHAVQSRDLRMLTVLEQKAWIQAARPYHLFGLSVHQLGGVLLWSGVPGPQDLSPESFGRRRLREQGLYDDYRQHANGADRAHGFEPFDVEHWSTDLLFDYWTVSGDEWAREELRQLGESLRGVLRLNGFYTSDALAARAEGWCMQSFVHAFLATGDLRFRDAALDRAHGVVDRDRVADGAYRALFVSGTDPRTNWPGPHRFYMPWQHGAVLFGYLAAWKFFGDPLLLTICDDVTYGVAHGWVQNVGHPQFGFVVDGLRYYVPVGYQGQAVAPSVFDASHEISFGDDPLGGAHSLLATGLLMLSQTSADPQRRLVAQQYGQLLLPTLDDDARWNKWFYCTPPPWNPLPQEAQHEPGSVCGPNTAYGTGFMLRLLGARWCSRRGWGNGAAAAGALARGVGRRRSRGRVR